MDASRQLGPPRQSDGTPNGQLNSTVQQLGGLSNNSNFTLHHLPPHMQQQLNGPVVRPANMTVSQQQQQPGTMTIQSPNSLQPGTAYLIRSPSGELQLVRLAGAPNAQQGPGGLQQHRPGLRPSNPQMPQNLRLPTPGNVRAAHHGPPQHQNLSEGAMMGGPNSISVPSGLGPGSIQQPQQHHLQNHLPNAGPPGHLQMPMTRPQPAPTNKIEDSLNKAKQFFNALLTMSKSQTPAMYSTARDLLQQLVDGKINPDMFAQRLQKELKSTPQPILAQLLKACLSKLREGLINGEINIEGINPPPASALNLPDLSLSLSGLNPSFQTLAQDLQNMGSNLKHSVSPEIPLRPPAPQTALQPASSKLKGGKNQKAAAVTSAVAVGAGFAAAGAPPSSDLHPVFSQLPHPQSHQKTEKTKATKPPAQKRITAKQKRDLQMKERRSQREADRTAIPTILTSANLCEGAAGFPRLANEELAMVLQYLDLVDRLLIRRVSKRWRFVMAQIATTQHVKPINHPATSLLQIELRAPRGCHTVLGERPRESWRYCPSGIHKLIVDYDSIETWWDGFQLCCTLAKRLLPSLTTLHLVNYWAPDIHICSVFLNNLPDSVHVVLRNSVVGLFIASGIPDGTCHDSRVDEPLFTELRRWCIRLPNFTVSGGMGGPYNEESSRVMWPYGDDELRWLASNAPSLNSLPKLLELFWMFMQYFSIGPGVTTAGTTILCLDHGMFCKHLDLSHYRQLNGHARRLLSLCILNVREEATASVELQGSSRCFQDDVYIMKDFGPSPLSPWAVDCHEWKI